MVEGIGLLNQPWVWLRHGFESHFFRDYTMQKQMHMPLTLPLEHAHSLGHGNDPAGGITGASFFA